MKWILLCFVSLVGFGCARTTAVRDTFAAPSSQTVRTRVDNTRGSIDRAKKATTDLSSNLDKSKTIADKVEAVASGAADPQQALRDIKALTREQSVNLDAAQRDKTVIEESLNTARAANEAADKEVAQLQTNINTLTKGANIAVKERNEAVIQLDAARKEKRKLKFIVSGEAAAIALFAMLRFKVPSCIAPYGWIITIAGTIGVFGLAWWLI